MRNFCAVAVVLATAVALAQNSAPTQPVNAAQQSAPAAANAAQDSAGNATVQNATATTTSPTGNAGDRNPADVKLESQVASLFAHKAEFQNVKVSASGGVVTLEGSVPTKIERRQAKALAHGVNGVKKVQERLTISGAGVAGPGTYANTTATASAQPGGVEGNASAPTSPATAVGDSNVGGTTGAAVSSTPPSSTVGAGSATQQATRMPVAKPTTPKAQQSTFGLTTVDTAGLAAKINNALKNDPNLAKNNVIANVSDQGVEVTGSVDTGKAKVTAMRIAQSYAGNFKVVDRITLAGRAPSQPNGQQNAATKSNEATATTNTPPPNIAGNQVLPTGTANTREPKGAEDKSSNPR